MLPHFINECYKNEEKQQQKRYNKDTKAVHLFILYHSGLKRQSPTLYRGDKLAQQMEHKLGLLPERFSETEWKNIVQLPGECVDVARIIDANYLLNLYMNPWEITEDYNQIYCGWELVPFNETT